MKKVIVKKNKEAAIRRFHPWVFSGAIKKMDKGVRDGDVVQVQTESGEFLANGHYQNGSISVRLFSFEAGKADLSFWIKKLQAALQVRQLTGLANSTQTNCYRLVHAEGDGLPGLIIDIYDKTAVIQCHSIGMHMARTFIAEALQEVYGGQLEAIYDKSAESLPLSMRWALRMNIYWVAVRQLQCLKRSSIFNQLGNGAKDRLFS